MAKSAGFCFGVSRSVNMAEELLRNGPCKSLGPVIHNDDVVNRLAAKGMSVVDSADEVESGDRILIRSHGVGRAVMDKLIARGAVVTDATCPNVSRIHKIVYDASAKGRQVVVIGADGHPEITGICGQCSGAVVVSDAVELGDWLESNPENTIIPLTIVIQTTQTEKNVLECKELIKKMCTNAEFFDTICTATSTRQDEAIRLASTCDAMVVIGGRHSANSLHLAKLCAGICGNTQFIEAADKLNVELLKNANYIGVTAGASAPVWIIKEVLVKMSEEILIQENQEAAPVEETVAQPVEAEVAAVVEVVAEEPAEAVEKTFDEMLEDSLKTIYNGDKVSGMVVAITQTEVSVDLGTKYSAFIPSSELTEDGELKLDEVVKIGDTIEAIVVRVNDVEGTAQLSKKRLDAIKNWSDIEAAQESGTIVEGTVTEENKGGIVVTVKGIRVFVPASQSGLPKDTPMTELLRTKARLKITEVNRGRRRVVGSIRAVAQRERRERAEAIWNEIEIGKVYQGVVKSLTSYGAFVDIGGIDGMVHVSELSWSRIKNPSDVVSVGDSIEVYVIGFDKDARRISLGHKKAEDNPWSKFVGTYSVGDVANVKIVKLMPFGAFAEVMPGVDGLIHISQIANHRIGKPDEVLSVGEMIDVKITAIDNDKQKISLSARALSEPEPVRRSAPREMDYNAPVESREDALVYEVSETGEATGHIPAYTGDDE